MTVSIKPMSAKHIAEISQIEEATFSHPWSKHAYEAELTNPLAKYLVLTVDDAVAGYGGFWLIFDEAHITNIAIKKEFRRKGYGSMLLAELIRTAEILMAERMTLEVRTSNENAKALYQKYGFNSVGKRPGYYPDGEDAEILWRKNDG